MTSISILLMIVIAAASGAPTQSARDCETCDFRVFDIFTKDDHPAPNIALVQFQYKCENEGCTTNMSNDELMRLHAAITPITVSAFSESAKAFSFMVKYTLTPDKPATIEMKASIPQVGNDELKAYYDEAANLTEYHSKKGTVEVLFHYKVNSPPQSFDND